jgi:hypothetical protein
VEKNQSSLSLSLSSRPLSVEKNQCGALEDRRGGERRGEKGRGEEGTEKEAERWDGEEGGKRGRRRRRKEGRRRRRKEGTEKEAERVGEEEAERVGEAEAERVGEAETCRESEREGRRARIGDREGGGERGRRRAAACRVSMIRETVGIKGRPPYPAPI